MLESFLTYIRKEKLFDSHQKVLLAVSGGIDSMVMLYLFQKSGYNFSAAHCNFQLRGDESDGDEQFVKDYCDEHNIQLFTTRFETFEYARQEGISIEMAARDLRYSWFNELIADEKFDCLATAHHQDDVIETFFINLSRGTGIRGLSGIKPKFGVIVRPVLFSDRATIRNYAALHQIASREDSSNSDTNIQRNFIRHKIIPMLDEFHPAFRKNIIKTADNLFHTELIFQQKLEEIFADAINCTEWGESIEIEKLKKCRSMRTVLFEMLKEKGFSVEQVDDIIHSLDGESGKKFFSSTHRIVKDREVLLLSKITNDRPDLVYIEKDCLEVHYPLRMRFERISRTANFHLSKNATVADFDYDKLEFPLLLRKWQEGEYFQPLGMSGLKKLSDFFIDEKYSIPEKENTWILTSGNKVVWVVNKRIDDRFKVESKTQNIYRISVDNS